ncbi:MAG TPA: DUF4292 domain-containing protein [Flavobacterium sp.]|jgi:hypothetical protein
MKISYIKKYVGLVLLVLLSSCKAKKAVVAEGNATEEVAAAKIINSHYNLKRDFKTLYIRADVSYKDNKQSQNVTAEIKIQKDKQILVSVRFLGITMAKALITPDKVQYYEKIGGKFFEGDYTTLSKWLGTDLDYYKVQNMLTGNALDNLKKGKYKSSVQDNLYKVEDLTDSQTNKTYYFESTNFLIKRQAVTQAAKNRKLELTYPNHKEYTEAILPAELIIEALENNKTTKITIEYNTVNFNQELSFPYEVPSGYDKVIIQ